MWGASRCLRSASTLSHFSITVTDVFPDGRLVADRGRQVDGRAIFEAALLGPHVGHQFGKGGQKVVPHAGGRLDRGNHVDHGWSFRLPADSRRFGPPMLDVH